MSEFEKLCFDLKLNIEAKFTPWSLSQNAGSKMPSLNWNVTLSKGERAILTSDYRKECGHCYSYPEFHRRMTVDELAELKNECQSGRHKGRGHTITLKEFMQAIVQDADALNYADFEEWAEAFGYSPDSRAAEKIYRACLDIGLRLRRAIGDEALAKLQELAASE